MKSFWKFFTKALASGFLIAVPVYLAMLLLLKAAKSLVGLVRPLAVLRPPGVPVEAAATGFALLFVLLICFALGAAALTEPGEPSKSASGSPSWKRYPAINSFEG